MQKADLKWFERSLLIFAGIALILTGLFFLVRHELAAGPYRLRDFSKYRSDFQILAWRARELYQEAKKEYGDDLKQIFICKTVDGWEVDPRLKSDPKSSSIFQVLPSESEKEAYQSVQTAIHSIHTDNSASFYGIRVTDKCVIFTTDMPTSICYGYRPYRAGSNRTQYVDVLALHWYQLVFA